MSDVPAGPAPGNPVPAEATTAAAHVGPPPVSNADLRRIHQAAQEIRKAPNLGRLDQAAQDMRNAPNLGDARARLLELYREAWRAGWAAAEPHATTAERERITQLARSEADKIRAANFSDLDATWAAVLDDFADLLAAAPGDTP